MNASILSHAVLIAASLIAIAHYPCMLSPLSFASFNIADSGISIIFIFCINVKSYFICLKASYFNGYSTLFICEV